MTDDERAEEIEAKLKKRADWLVLRDLAERLFVADYPTASEYHDGPTIARAAFMFAEEFVAEANKRAPQ